MSKVIIDLNEVATLGETSADPILEDDILLASVADTFTLSGGAIRQVIEQLLREQMRKMIKGGADEHDHHRSMMYGMSKVWWAMESYAAEMQKRREAKTQ